MRRFRTMVATLLWLAAAAAFSPTAQAGDKWNFELAPYVWASAIDGDVTLLGQNAELDESFSDLLDVLDGAFMIHFGGHGEKWGFVSDFIYIDLSEDLEMPSGKADYEQWIIDVAGTRRVAKGTDILVGFRYTSLDGELRFSGPLMLNPQRDLSWTDPFVGVRWAKEYGDRWHLGLRGDIGGFGVESDFTWQARATATYRFSRRWSLAFGLRALDYDFEDGEGLSRFAYDVTMSGAEVGFVFNF